MKRLMALLVAVVLVIPVGAMAQSRSPAGPPERVAHPPIHPKGPAQSTLQVSGYQPWQMLTAYGISGTGAGQVIAIIDAYDDPTIASDLQTFVSTFNGSGTNGGSTNNKVGSINNCTVGTGPKSTPCFQKVYAQGRKPKANGGWALEISLDVEWAHAIAPQADILLVEALTNSFSNLMGAVNYAVNYCTNLPCAAGVHVVVSMSWGGGEFCSIFGCETSYDSYFANGIGKGIMFTASSGDSGGGTSYPAASPYVLSVGGTTLTIDGSGHYVSETAWSGSGGGQSLVESEPGYQSCYPIPYSGARAIPDVAYDADPNTGVDVYDSTQYNGHSGWWVVGGTSVGAPSWAALIALANAGRTSGLKTDPSSGCAGGGATGLPLGSPVYYFGYPYSTDPTSNYQKDFYDIVSGNNGLYSAGAGYDLVTGLGSPKAGILVSNLFSFPY